MPSYPIQTARLILCEGIEDAAFLRALIRNRNIGSFDVRAVEDICGHSGIGAFGRALAAAVVMSGFSSVRSIALVADSDEHHGKAFSGLCNQITRANADTNVSGRFGIPITAFNPAGGHPRITVILNPAPASNGCLETLLLVAARSTPSHAAALGHIEHMADQIGIVRGPQRWHYSKVDKVRLHTLIAVTNKKNPALGLGRLWSQYPTFIDLVDPAFNALEAHLRAL